MAGEGVSIIKHKLWFFHVSACVEAICIWDQGRKPWGISYMPWEIVYAVATFVVLELRLLRLGCSSHVVVRLMRAMPSC